jgi:hypothetical protein
MTYSIVRLAAGGLLATLLAGGVSEAQVIAHAVPLDDLVRLDLSSGAVETIGPLTPGVGPLGDLAFDPAGTLLGFEFDGGGLVAIDTESAATAVVGSFDLGQERGVGLTVDACGRIFLMTAEFGGSAIERRLRRLDPQTGEAPLVAEIGVDLGPLAAWGEDLYGTLPSGTGSGTPPVIVRIRPAPLEIEPVAGPVPWSVTIGAGLDFDAEGDLWALFAFGLVDPLPPPLPALRFDLTSGEVESFPQSQYGFPFAISPPGGACVSGTPLAIPAAGGPGLLVLAAALAAAGAVALRRRYSSP